MTNPLPTEQQRRPKWADAADPIGDIAIRLAAHAHSIEAEEGEWTWRDLAKLVDEMTPARPWPTDEIRELIEAARPFVNILGDREVRYRTRGGNLDDFPDTHPSFDIKAEQIPIGFYRRLRAALTAMGEKAC